MISRQHVVGDFFADGEAMRASLDLCFKDAYADNIRWSYFCDPRKYTYLRAQPWNVFPKELYDRFMQRLRQWCMESLGLAPVNQPYLNVMVNGCMLGLHSDFQNGAWGYVYSLTRWENRKFSGGETLLMKDGVPSYKKHHVHGDALYELIPARFNQLLVFDDRIVHATPIIEGTMELMESRIALVGHIRATSPLATGSIQGHEARSVVLGAMSQLSERIKNYKDVQGTITYKLAVAATGAVESVTVLTDNVVTPASGYGRSDAVGTVKSIIQQTMARLKFPATSGASSVIVPVLVPLPDLHPIEITVPHDSSPEGLRAWAAAHLSDIDRNEVQGDWEGSTYLVREPIAGSIRIEPRQIAIRFDAPMWVPSQRESFELALTNWAQTAAGARQ